MGEKGNYPHVPKLKFFFFFCVNANNYFLKFKSISSYFYLKRFMFM
jgi:hypothetical protein